MSKPNHKKARLETGPTGSVSEGVTGGSAPINVRAQTNRPVGSGGGNIHRGDRRDTHPSYSTGKVNRDGGRAGPLGASTRKSGPRTSKKPGGGD
ncbi:MAG TPA: hypothetical protein VF624_14445 [Tepidisphaeraceae bacterium]|jgi:hypothetical protein